MNRKMMLLLVASLMIFSGASFITGCGKGGDKGGDPGYIGPGPGGNNNPTLSATIRFDIAGSESLVATKNVAAQTPASALGKLAEALGLRQKSFTFYETGGSAVRKAEPRPGDPTGPLPGDPYGGSGAFTTNFFAVKADGTMGFAVQSDNGGFSAPVMYSVLSKDGTYVYIAFQNFMTSDSCAIYKVKVADNTYTCLDAGYIPQDVNSYQQYYSKKINGNIKPIQLDEAGNVYYLGYKVTDMNNTGNYYGQAPVVRKVGADGTAITLTSDVTNVQSFLIMKNGVLVYTYQSMDGGSDAGIKIYDPAALSTNKLTDASAGQWWGDMFFAVDDKDTVVFGSANSQAGGVFFGQRFGSGGRYVVKLDTSLFGNTSGNGWSSAPTRLIIGDDGNLYGLFIENNPVMGNTGQYDPMQQENYLKLYQILPYAGAPRASVKLASQDWWTAMNGVDTQVSKGYAYMVEKETNISGTFSDRTIIKVFKFSDGTITKLLSDDAWSQRYDIYTWKLVGDLINFSGFDNGTSQMVMGTVDTNKVKNGEPSSSYLAVRPVASAAGASSQIQDMEVLKPQQPKVDTGDYPAVQELFADPENLYSASVKFSKYMDKELAGAGVHVKKTADSSNVPAMKVWFSQTLHLIVDADSTATAATMPLGWDTEYALSVDPTVKDAWGWDIKSLTGIGLSKAFKTRPETGWYLGTDSVPAAAGDGNVGKYVTNMNTGPTPAPQAATAMRLVENSPVGNFRVQFSARNKGSWGDLIISLKDATQATQANQEWNNIARVSLSNSGFNYNATDTTGMSVWGDNWNLKGFGNYWSQYTLDLYGDRMTLTVDYLNGAAPVKLIDRQGLSFSPCTWSMTTNTCVNTTAWDLDFRINSSSVVFDNFVVSRLTSAGTVTGEPILNELFSGPSITTGLENVVTYTQ